jgi:hypothetical protein
MPPVRFSFLKSDNYYLDNQVLFRFDIRNYFNSVRFTHSITGFIRIHWIMNISRAMPVCIRLLLNILPQFAEIAVLIRPDQRLVWQLPNGPADVLYPGNFRQPNAHLSGF